MNTDGGRQGGQAGTEETYLVRHSACSPEMNVAWALGWVLGIHSPAPGSSQAGRGGEDAPSNEPRAGCRYRDTPGSGEGWALVGLAGFEDMEACQGG